VFIEATDDGGGGDNWNTGAIIKVVESSSQIITTNKPTFLFAGRMHFLSPNQQCQSTEGKFNTHTLFNVNCCNYLPDLIEMCEQFLK